MNYYISNSGNDSNNGTSQATAWATLSKVNSFTFVAGDYILFNRGDTFYGSMVINNAGTSGNPIVFGAYGVGKKPVITGLTQVAAWINLGGNIWESTSAVSTLSTCAVVVIDGVNTAMGRYPNQGYLTYESFTAGASITSSELGDTIFGSNLVSNGEFNTGAGWGGSGITFSSGQVNILGAWKTLSQSVSVTNGNTYRVFYDVINKGAFANLYFYASTSFVQTQIQLDTSIGSHYVDVICGDSTKPLLFNTNGDSNDITLDNVELKEITHTYNIDWTGAEAVIKKNNWIIDRCLITSQSEGTLNYSNSNSYPGQEYYGFFIQNDPRTLSVQNEWYFNPTTKKIQVYSVEEPMDVRVSSVEHIVSMLYKNSVTFDGISFQGGNINGIHIRSCADITVVNSAIDFCYNGLFGQDYGQSSINFLFYNNTVNNINNNGVDVRSEFTNGIINRNEFNNCGMLLGMSGKADAAAQSIMQSSEGLTIRYNRINNSGYLGIGNFGNGANVSNNFIRNSCMIKDDGAGIYFYITGNNTIAKNIIIDSIGTTEGIDTRYGQGTSAFGIYLDHLSSNCIVEDNTVVNATKAGIYLQNINYVTVRNNTVFDSGKASLLINDLGDTNNNNINNNKFISRSLPTLNYWGNPDFSQLAMELVSNGVSILNFGTFDYNYYARPIDNGSLINVQPNGNTQTPGLYSLYDLQGWQNYSGQDANSQGSPVTITDDNKFRFEYNDSEISKVISLEYPMVDITGQEFSGDIILEPFSSIVLIDNSTPKKLLKIGNKILKIGAKLLVKSS